MKINIDIKSLVIKEDPKFKVKRMIETIAGTVRAHFPHHKFEIIYEDVNLRTDHKLFFDPREK